MNPVVRSIIGGARKYSAVDTFERNTGCGLCGGIRSASGRAWTCWWCRPPPTIYTHEEIASDPVRRNTNLGYYTNFVNLLDQAAVAVPAGFRSDGLPFGISFIGPAFTDEGLLALADRFHRAL